MIKIEETTIKNGPLHSKGYQAKLESGVSNKYKVRYHIDHDVGDVYDLIADMSKMIWLLNRKIEDTTTADDTELEQKLTDRMSMINDILGKYYG